MNMMNNREKVLKVVNLSPIPVNVDYVRRQAGIGNWQTAKAWLMELVAEGTISGLKTTKGWIFWALNPPNKVKNK